MAYKFTNKDYKDGIELDRFELTALVDKFIRPEDPELCYPIERRPVCTEIESLWRRDVNGNKLKFAIVRLSDGSHIAILGEHLRSYVSFIESYTGIDCLESGNVKPKGWYNALRSAVDDSPLFVVNAFRSPL